MIYPKIKAWVLMRHESRMWTQDVKAGPAGLESTTETYRLFEHTHAVHARTLLVDWMLGNACSYACSYCPKSLHDGTVRWQKADDVVGFYQDLFDHYVTLRDQRVWLQFTGGEPTMHPQIIRLLSQARGFDFLVSLISNGSRTHRFWSKIKPNLDAIILTYHSEFADNDHFHGVCDILAGDVAMHINVTMPPDRFDKVHEDALKLKERFPDASVSLKPLRVDFGTRVYDYTDRQRAILDAGLRGGGGHPEKLPRAKMTVHADDGSRMQLRVNELVMRKLNKFQGYQCNAGLESLRVKADGEIFRATCSAGGLIGLLGQSVELPNGPIRCPMDDCGCTADILVTKTRLVGGEA